MDVEELRNYCLSFPGVTEGLPFGPDTLVFKSEGKIFTLVSLDNIPLSFNVKCDPEKALELREQHSCVLPGYHMNKKYWNTVVVDGSLPASTLKEFIAHSYDLVTTKGRSRKS